MDADYYDEDVYQEEDDQVDWEEYYTHDEDGLVAPSVSRQETFTILKPDELEVRQRKAQEDVAELLGVTVSEAGVLLRHYRWNKNALQEAWFDNENSVREKCGLAIPGSVRAPESETIECPICYDSAPLSNTFALGCGHRFCNDCWKGFVNNMVDEGANCIFSHCAAPKCKFSLPEEMVRAFADPERVKKYNRYLMRSYVDDNKNVKWCPNAGCENAAENPSRAAKEIKCSCAYIFCFNCSCEGHRPSTCSVVENWGAKNSAESENVTWILANTKQCPQCRRPIEKNQGCNHMTCVKNAGGCGFEFCWLCSGPWTEHGSSTGGYYKCNKYDRAVKEGKTKEEDKARTKAKTDLEKYMFYFERFINHDKARKVALKQHPQIEDKVQLLHDIKGYPVSELQFLLDALDQVIECRRILKWTYPFGYYLDNVQEKNLFEHLQQQLEENTEHLHELLERPLDKFLDPNALSKSPFYEYKSELTNYTNVTKKFLQNLLEGIENGLTEI